MSIRIQSVDWHVARSALYAVRHQVFVMEQNVPEEIEVDALDPLCHHFLATTGEHVPIGTARVTPDGHIGRVAVLKQWRRRGVGRALMDASIQFALSAGFATIFLNSQQSAAGFYRRLGFESYGEPFIEAGIAHIAMRRVASGHDEQGACDS